jgi:hypothetical protein
MLTATFPVFIVIPDEGTIQRFANERALTWFEAIDLDEFPHRGWDYSTRPIILCWNESTEKIDIKVFRASDREGFVAKARDYILRASERMPRGAPHTVDPHQLELDLQQITRQVDGTSRSG